MARPLSLTDLPDDVARLAEAQLASGRFSTLEEVIRAGAEALRERQDEAKLVALRAALEEGERSRRSDYSLEKVLAELDAETAH
jgi:putative addiction module CopG family antidote